MKKTNKILVPLATVVTAAGFIGSITGSFAWFQYSTRVTAAYTGTAAHCSENIEISLDGSTWKKDLALADVENYLTNTLGRSDTALHPTTAGEQSKDKGLSLIYKNPVYQYEDIAEWGVASIDHEYITFPLYFRVLDINGLSNRLLEKNLYLTDVSIDEKAVTGKLDISNAVRVQLHTASTDRLISKTGEDVATHGQLDLNADGYADRTTGYEWDATSVIDYGIGEVKGSVADATALAAIATPADGDVYLQVDSGEYKKYNEANTAWETYAPVSSSYAIDDANAISDDSDPYNITGADPIGKTVAGVPALADLPVVNEVRKVNSLNKNYKFNGTAWAETTDAVTKSAVESLDQLITPAVNDVYLALDKNLQYKWSGTAWEIACDETVAALPTDLAAIGDAYHDTTLNKDVYWDGTAWVKGGDHALGDATTAELEAKVVSLSKTYYNSTDEKLYNWSGNGTAFNLKDLNLKAEVTIYLEGWHPFANKGDVANKAALAANYLATSDTYHVTDIDANYTWNGTEWVAGGDGSTGTVATFYDLRLPTDSFHALEDDKIYVYNGTEWVEGSGSAIWDDQAYVGASFYVGLRFSAEAHNDH